MIERFSIRPDYEISRIIKGGWQLSEGHSQATSTDPTSDMFAFVERGINTFDCADIYTGVEEFIGNFIQENKQLNEPWPVRIHTKYVPNYDQLGSLTKAKVEKVIDRSLERLNLEQLDMVQFHWWNYQVFGWIEAAGWLKELQQAGKINLLSTTNFNSETTREMILAGITPATLQVQYSLLDPRPEKALTKLCDDHDMYLLCYGTLAGGFLSKSWLGESEARSLSNRSLVKYKLMIDEIGGWDIFQALLQVLDQIAQKHSCSISSVAVRYILDKPQVAAAIVGARNADHVQSYDQIFSLNLDDDDKTAIESIRQQMSTPGLDVFDLERDKEGPHGRIMKYNLNAS